MTKQDLINDINTRTNFCIGDANTYLWAKCQLGFERAADVGGGNFAVFLISFSLLDLLSYVNGILNQKPEYTENEIRIIEKNLKTIGLHWPPPKKGQIKSNTKDLVKALIQETSSRTGIDTRNIDLLWSVRHKLIHEFTPKFLPAASSPLMPGGDYEKSKIEARERAVFCKGEGNQVCIDVHAFNHKLHKVAHHVTSKIEQANDIMVEKIINWLVNN